MFHPIRSIKNRRVRIALVGCGRISLKHISAIASHHERAELVAICDVHESRLDEAQSHIINTSAEFPGASTHPIRYDNYQALLEAVREDRIQLDLVFATPSGLPGSSNFSCSIRTSYMYRKPMATRWSDGLAMVRA